MKEGSINELIRLIAQGWIFDEKDYPKLKELNKEDRIIFAVRHCALHFAKTAGKISAVSEHIDHGEPMNVESLKVDVIKSLVSTLRLAKLIDLSGEEIVRAIEEKYKER